MILKNASYLNSFEMMCLKPCFSEGALRVLGVGVLGRDMNFDRSEKADLVDEKDGRAAASSLKSREKSTDLSE